MQTVLQGAGQSLAVGLLVAALVAGSLLPFRVLQPVPEATGRRGVLRWPVVCGYVAAVGAATLVPFPDPASLTCPNPEVDPQWVPLDVLRRIGGGAAGSLGLDPALVHLLLNVALFLPLGILLGRVWGMRSGRVLGTALLVSLGIELTQLTGVWSLYDCAYRVFDVDDLLANALGGLAGAVLARWTPRGPRAGSRRGAEPPMRN